MYCSCCIGPIGFRSKINLTLLAIVMNVGSDKILFIQCIVIATLLHNVVWYE